jgi:hypothetical protein
MEVGSPEIPPLETADCAQRMPMVNGFLAPARLIRPADDRQLP